ncbi:sterol desaturase family protein [Paenactinomyces guangxiensis]|uniref:Sterol desaturase family protein n=1 Tax=Paenactinomyces guangxiensis TaxID=1490290 RepID=A0A7W2A7G9_9BACL|nr:sterol desaturase family protein [Paenactinomyces guangxiensis]MBA4493114.1 sterol desaturase family protein [Paenactinomyces guangxiensis]MBH8590036.1 sterol desaturase family protein [Paenactinomyces guangxiensis]
MSKYLKEFLFFPDIFIMCLVFFAGISTTLTWSDRGWTWLALALGALLFAISEYLTHRFIFHLKPPKNQFLLQLLKRLHYDHHEDPNNLKLLFLPLWYTGPQFIAVGIIAFFITKDISLTVGFLTGGIAYHLYYEWKHYVAHRPVKPFTSWGRKLKKYHLLHHFKSEHYWYGVTNPAIDHLMGTFKNEKEVETSPTVRKLMAEESKEQVKIG